MKYKHIFVAKYTIMKKVIILFFAATILLSCTKETVEYKKEEKCGVVVRLQPCYVFIENPGYIYTVDSNGELFYIAKKEKYNIKEKICFNP